MEPSPAPSPIFYMTTSAYKNLTAAQMVFKDLVWTPLLNLGKAAIQVELPFLALPIISPIFRGITGLVTDWVFDQIIVGVDISAIRLVNDAHQSAYNAASVHLAVVAHDKGVDSPEYRAAKQKAMDALSKFTRFGS